MSATASASWERFKKWYKAFPSVGLAVDLSRLKITDEFMAQMKTPIQKAFIAMAELEKGGIANPDEKRMVGHYWLRNPRLAPTRTIAAEIEKTLQEIKDFAGKIHSGEIRGKAGAFKNLLIIGIGGSALGPQFVAEALGDPRSDRMRIYFFDNTDPDGIDKVLAELQGELGSTLAIVISKSGGTKETRNGMLEAEAAFQKAGFEFARQAVAVTGFGSELSKYAISKGWIHQFPMWDWVGGRTSELSAVGLLPAALQGFDIDNVIKGANEIDELTRNQDPMQNPAALLALGWFCVGNGKGTKDMVVLPYKDRLELFSRYLQQLVMESLGKEKDLAGKIVNQGIAVYGNKGSTDQHAYVQQLREGINNFFAVFVEVLKDRKSESLQVEPGVTSGDYLHGFFMGTRAALFEKDRESITITIPEVSAYQVGLLIALFERAVGFYASLVNINAYHQPGVEAGKKAATEIIDLQKRIVCHLGQNRDRTFSAPELASVLGVPDSIENVFKICEHLAANPEKEVSRIPGKEVSDTRFKSL